MVLTSGGRVTKTLLAVRKRPLPLLIPLAAATTTKSSSSSSWSCYNQQRQQQRQHWAGSNNPDGDGSSTSSTTHPTSTGQPAGTMMLYNTLSGRVEPLPVMSPTTNKGMAWYTCGPTTYAPAHLGHARTYVCLDIIRRVLADTSMTMTTETDESELRQPLFVMNITDIDDKIIAAAAAAANEDDDTVSDDTTKLSTSHSFQNDAIGLARYWEKEFWKDWDDLNCLRPHVVTRVTEHVESDIVPFIQRLVENGLAYEIVETTAVAATTTPTEKEEHGGGVYFDVRAFNEISGARTRYGKLAPPAAAQDIPSVFESQSVLSESVDCDNASSDDMPVESSRNTAQSKRTEKRDYRDFALWKNIPKTGKDTNDSTASSCGVVSWPSPWGHGRPGWHIECSAMIQAVQKQFQDTYEFQVHAGGIDLKFPHHTNEIAQSEAYMHYSYSLASPCAAGSRHNEWIPHWVHTGHLHIDGLKMSKSLKNFVTIRDFLDGKILGSSFEPLKYNHDQPSIGHSRAFDSPSDDFRLWCLGLSGSYRGPATFSVDRMKEARSIRHKIIRFLVEGEEWIRQSGHNLANDTGSKKFEEEDFELFQKSEEARSRGLEALRYHDLDGAKFVSQVCLIAETGSEYMKKRNVQSCPVEPMMKVVRDTRTLLQLVGFTQTTTDAGIVSSKESNHSFVSGGERALIDELVKFRSIVRKAALRDVRSSASPSPLAAKEILKASDELRDTILPSMGLQLLDGDGDSAEQKDGWMLCFLQLPQSHEKNRNDSSGSTITNSMDLTTIPLPDFFKVGQHKGQFSAYTEDGVPTHNADGTEVSKRLHQKLMKKRKKHEERIRNNLSK